MELLCSSFGQRQNKTCYIHESIHLQQNVIEIFYRFIKMCHYFNSDLLIYRNA